MDGNWKELEKTYGVPISNDVRQRFIKVTENYLEWGAFERNAQPISKARKRIKRLKQAAAVLLREMIEGAEQASDAVVYADRLIRKNLARPQTRRRVPKNLQDPLLSEKDSLRKFADTLSSFQVACKRALEEIDDASVHRNWDYWCVWVVELRKIAMKSNLPYGEREDGKEYDSDAPSAFVALINKLQNYLPKEYRRRAKTTSALAKHINRCRVAREGSGTN